APSVCSGLSRRAFIPAWRLAWHPDRKHLLAVPPRHRTAAWLWKLDGTGPSKLMAPGRRICSAEWSPGGKYLAVGCVGGTVLVRRAASRPGARAAEEIWRSDGLCPDNASPSVAWAPDGTRLATGSPL